MRLDKVNLGLAGGILSGLMVFILTLIAIGTNYGDTFLSILIDIYPGYTITATGSIIGLIYGFLDGFIALFLLAWLYNMFEARNEKIRMTIKK